MGTMAHSTITTARKAYECRHCDQPIVAGERYLRYAAGLRNRYPVCLDCALTVRGEAGFRRYDCYAIRAEARYLSTERTEEG